MWRWRQAWTEISKGIRVMQSSLVWCYCSWETNKETEWEWESKHKGVYDPVVSWGPQNFLHPPLGEILFTCTEKAAEFQLNFETWSIWVLHLSWHPRVTVCVSCNLWPSQHIERWPVCRAINSASAYWVARIRGHAMCRRLLLCQTVHWNPHSQGHSQIHFYLGCPHLLCCKQLGVNVSQRKTLNPFWTCSVVSACQVKQVCEWRSNKVQLSSMQHMCSVLPSSMTSIHPGSSFIAWCFSH